MSVPSSKISSETIALIKDAANEQLDLVFNELGINVDNVVGFNDEIRTACPIHEGDNASAFCYNLKHKFWRCYTKGCHEGKGNIFGLVELTLKKTNPDATFRDSCLWLSRLLKIDIESDSDVNDEDLEINRTINYVKSRIRKSVKPKENSGFPISIEAIKGKVKPSWYFLEKGFSEEVLAKYNVGFCDDPYKPMYLRSYAPVLDEDGRNILGVTGRVKYEACEYCPLFHEQGKGCPKENFRVKGYTKWQHYGFNTSEVFYNSWFAKDFIEKSKLAVITEGPKENWWFEQHGIHNSLCTFGLNVHNYHVERLLNYGCLHLILAFDKDPRGIAACEKINEQLSDYFRITNLHKVMTDKDIDESTPEEMNKITDFIKGWER